MTCIDNIASEPVRGVWLKHTCSPSLFLGKKQKNKELFLPRACDAESVAVLHLV